MAPIKGHSSCAFVLTSARSTQVRRPKENRNPSGRVAVPSPRRGEVRSAGEGGRERERGETGRNNAAREEEDKKREGEGEGREKAEARSETS